MKRVWRGAIIVALIVVVIAAVGGWVLYKYWPSDEHYTAPPNIIGALNPAVTQATIHQTICVPGWTKTVRPPSSYTNNLKRQQLPPGAKLSDYEEDHLMPLALGGSPTDPKNLKPIPWPRARQDDKWEVRLHNEVCSGKITLKEGQQKMSDIKRDEVSN